jgi:hypothetical protein
MVAVVRPFALSPSPYRIIGKRAGIPERLLRGDVPAAPGEERRTPLDWARASPIFACERETTKNAVGFTIPMMRDELVAACETLRSCGDPSVHYVDGLEILGADDAHFLPDNLHPDAAGYRLMGERFLERVIPKVFPERSRGPGAHQRV